MASIIILREEIVCFILLVFLASVARRYHMGEDSRIFTALLSVALSYVVLETATIWIVNHPGTVASWLVKVLLILRFLAAILYADQFYLYVYHQVHPETTVLWAKLSLIPVGIYLLLTPVMSIGITEKQGILLASGTAMGTGIVMVFVYFAVALGLILVHWGSFSNGVRYTLLLMLLVLVVSEIIQMIVPEFLFTGGAMTVITIGFFFSLENPVAVLERKMMTDAMTGVENRNCYERDIQKYDREFRDNPDRKFIFFVRISTT